MSKPSFSLSFPLWLAGLLQTGLYYSRLPERMGSHFDITGQVDAWVEKPLFFITYLCVLCLILGLPEMFQWVMESFPGFYGRNVDLARIRKQCQLFSVATACFALAVAHLVYSANLSRQLRLSVPGIWVILILYILFMIGWGRATVKAFR